MTEEASPALWPCGGMASALKFGATSPNRKNSPPMAATNIGSVTTSAAAATVSAAEHDEARERRVREAAHAEMLDQVDVGDGCQRHQRGDRPEDQGEVAAEPEDVDEHPLGARSS
jgi:hypothetical protein